MSKKVKVLIILATGMLLASSSCTPGQIPGSTDAPTGTNSTISISTPIQGTERALSLQIGNRQPFTKLTDENSDRSADNRIGDVFPLDRYSLPCPPAEDDWSFTHVVDLGLGWVRLSLDSLELEAARYAGNYSEFSINECQDEMISLLAENDTTILYYVVYWDRELHALDFPDYSNPEDIHRYLDYTRLVVHQFRDRIQYYEILNEPVNYADVNDYINLIRRAIPVIRGEYPQARIVVGGSTNLLIPYAREFLFTVLKSDIISLVDGIAIHPLYGASPLYEETQQYYYDYPTLIQEIKDTASVHGFTGEYFAEEMDWRTSINPNPNEPWQYSPTVAAKYYARGIMMNLGLDIWAGIGGERYYEILPVVHIVQNLSATMAGAKPESLSITIQSDAKNIEVYSFLMDNGDHSVAFWTDGVAVDDDPGVPVAIVIPGFSNWSASAIDVLHGFEQQLTTSNENGNLIISNLLIKDYPIIIHLYP